MSESDVELEIACPLITAVVPCYNESKNLDRLYRVLLESLANYQFEIVLIDDGSKDSTALEIQRIAESDSRVRGLIFSRNFGKESAMLAGLRVAKGDRVVILDGDLQHPPSLISEMVSLMDKSGVDQVVACRNRSGDPLIRTLFSKAYYRLVNSLVDVKLQDGAGDFRLLSRAAVEALLQLGESNRFSKGLFAWIGFPTEYIHYDNVVREQGQSAWTPSKLLNYAVDGVVSFNTKPLRLAIYTGSIFVFLSLLYVAFLFMQWAIYGVSVPGYITTIAVIVLLSGVQFLAIGIIGEYVGRIYQEVKCRPHYVIMADTDDA